MALELKQSLKLSQSLVMTPQLQQAIKLLQLSRIELEATIQEELLQNPVLEEGADLTPVEELPGDLAMNSVESERPAPADAAPTDRIEEVRADDSRTDIDWETYLQQWHDQPSTPGAREVVSEDLPSLQDTLTRSESLEQHLLDQLRTDDLTDAELQAGAYLICSLDDDGYFRSEDGDGDPLLALALATGVSATTAARVLRRVQHYDPVGCGSRDLQECLLVQAQAWMKSHQGDPPEADGDVVIAILRGHLKLLETKNYPAIARQLERPMEEVLQAIQFIMTLEPKPGRRFITQEAQYITPDVYIHKMDDGQYVVQLNDDGLSKLRISDAYRRGLSGDGKETKEFIQEKLRSAVWLIRSIHQRQRTIFKVTESIVKFQRDFLDKGVQHLKPLILRNVADDIGMHESTVSRVTTNKYVHTAQGIFELKYFFNSSIARTSGDDIASEAVKSKIKQLVAQEPADAPFSDQKLVELLAKQGIDIARRTVAKYRESLSILPSSKRKRYF